MLKVLKFLICSPLTSEILWLTSSIKLYGKICGLLQNSTYFTSKIHRLSNPKKSCTLCRSDNISSRVSHT